MFRSFACSSGPAPRPGCGRRWTLIRRTEAKPAAAAGNPLAPPTRLASVSLRLPRRAAPPRPALGARAHAQGRSRRGGAAGCGCQLCYPSLCARAGDQSPRLLRLPRSVVVMDSPWDDLALAFSRTSMFPFFDIAHYLVSVMAVKRQPGECGAPRAGTLGVPLTARPV